MMFWKKTPPPAPVNRAPEAEKKPLPMCEDCTWFRPYQSTGHLNLSKCANPDAQQDNGAPLVARNGGDDALVFCCNARSTERQCGRAAKHFQPKPPRPVAPVGPPYKGVLDNIDCSMLRIAKQLEALTPAVVKIAAGKKK